MSYKFPLESSKMTTYMEWSLWQFCICYSYVRFNSEHVCLWKTLLAMIIICSYMLWAKLNVLVLILCDSCCFESFWHCYFISTERSSQRCKNGVIFKKQILSHLFNNLVYSSKIKLDDLYIFESYNHLSKL